ncbi:hypothetical protein LCGC14_2609630, partial [marine sediment metagenome]
MKCKNCEHQFGIHHNSKWCQQSGCFCKQFTPSQNKGCGKRFAVIENIHIPCGLHLCPSCKLKPTNECQISSSNHSSIDDDKDPDSLKRLDEKGTNTS